MVFKSSSARIITFEFLFRNPGIFQGCSYKTCENSNFLKNGKIVISVKIQNFSSSRMTKRTSLLILSR